MGKLRPSLVAALVAAALLLNACGSKEAEPTPPSLYDRLGQVDGISKIVDKLMANVVAETTEPNSVMLRSHKPLLDANDAARVLRLRNNFIDQLGEATGGPLKYKGMNMLAAHTGMKITDNEFAVWRKAADASFEANNVPAKERAELAAILDAMKADVVGH